jgi:hypothetical protein
VTSDAGRDAAVPDAGVATPDATVDARSGDAGSDAGALRCMGGSTCHLVSATTATGFCSLGTMASCAPANSIDCDCGASTEPVRLFFWPPSGAGGRLEWAIVMGANPSFFTGLTLQMDDRCAGGGGLTSCNVVSACGDMPDGTQVYVFPVPETLDGHDLTTRGTHEVRVFHMDDAAPCDSAPELVAADYLIP